MSFFASSLARVLGAGFLCAPAVAETWVVDAFGTPGHHFRDLQAAIDGSQPGDLLLVRSGLYSSFQLDRARTILALAYDVVVLPGSRIGAVPFEEVAALARLRMSDLRIEGSQGTVLLDEVWIDGWGVPASKSGALLRVDGAADVRILGGGVDGTFAESVAAAFVSGSRLEAVQASFVGGWGSLADCGVAGRGGDALELGASTYFHASRSSFRGGEGGRNTASCPSLCGFAAGNGGFGIELGYLSGQPAPLALIAGSGSEQLVGGAAGEGTACDCDGFSAPGLRLLGGRILLSLQEPLAGPANCPGHAGPAVSVEGLSEIVPTATPWPTLSTHSNPGPGEHLLLEVRGEPDADLRLVIGLRPLHSREMELEVGERVRPRRTFELPPLDRNGRAVVALQMPEGYPQGSLVIAQASVLGSAGLRRTNSTALVLR